MSTDDWTRLQSKLKARMTTLGLSEGALARKAGVTEGTIRNWTNPERREFTKRPWIGKQHQVEKAIGWGPGSIEAILDGGDELPVTQSVDDEQAKADDLDLLRRTIAEADWPAATKKRLLKKVARLDG